MRELEYITLLYQLHRSVIVPSAGILEAVFTAISEPQQGGAYVDNSTMSDNGVEIHAGYNGTYIENTIFNVSPGGHRIVSDFGPVTSNGYNIRSDDGSGYLSGSGDQINTDPLLGPLQDNGGSTSTHELLPGSPSINAGDPNFVGPPDYDQRGLNYYRVRGGRIDIGSFEVQKPSDTFSDPYGHGNAKTCTDSAASP